MYGELVILDYLRHLSYWSLLTLYVIYLSTRWNTTESLVFNYITNIWIFSAQSLEFQAWITIFKLQLCYSCSCQCCILARLSITYTIFSRDGNCGFLFFCFCFFFCFFSYTSPFFLTCSFLLWQQHAQNVVMEGLRTYNFRLDQLMSRQQYSIRAWMRLVEVLGERTDQDILIETSYNYIPTLLFSNKVSPKSDLVWIDWLWVMANFYYYYIIFWVTSISLIHIS